MQLGVYLRPLAPKPAQSMGWSLRQHRFLRNLAPFGHRRQHYESEILTHHLRVLVAARQARARYPVKPGKSPFRLHHLTTVANDTLGYAITTHYLVQTLGFQLLPQQK